MNKSPHRRRFLLAAVVAVLLLPVLLSANNDKKIFVSVGQDASGNTVLTFDNVECPAGWNEKKGCVLQRKGNSGKIEWRLNDAFAEDGWELVALYFGAEEKQPGVVGFPHMGCLVDDFEFDQTDAATGFVRSAKQKAGGQALELKNNTACDTVYYIYYTLEARKGQQVATSDPIISNGGRPDRGN